MKEKVKKFEEQKNILNIAYQNIIDEWKKLEEEINIQENEWEEFLCQFDLKIAKIQNLLEDISFHEKIWEELQKKIDLKIKYFQKMQKKIEKEKNSLNLREESNNKIIKELGSIEKEKKELKLKEKNLVKREKEIERLEKELKYKKQELENFEKSLIYKEKYLKEKEEKLNKEKNKLIKIEKGEKGLDMSGDSDKVKTGILRLDELLYGGYPKNSNILVCAPPFTGKEILLYKFICEGLKNNEHCIIISTERTVLEIRNEIKEIFPKIEIFEKKGLVKYIDVYSRSVGIKEDGFNADYIESQKELDKIILAVENAQKSISKNKGYRMVFDSLSSLITYCGAPSTFKFLNKLIGKSKKFEAVSLFSIDKGMHKKDVIQMFKHSMSGMIEFEDKNIRTMLRICGICDVQTKAWVEYKYNKKELDIIGSFSLDRIK